jgi:hypothetical protein
MSKLADDKVSKILRQCAMDRLYAPAPAKIVLPDKPAFYAFAVDHVGKSGPIIYLEFGVANGGSMRHISMKSQHPHSCFYGFDSFEGLPENWLFMERGHFSTGGLPPSIEDSRIRFIKGWHQNTLPTFLADFSFPLSVPVLVHFDSDLYASTLFLLCSLWPIIKKYHFMMDDFIYDECVAMNDFASAFPVDIDFIATFPGESGSPDRVFGQIQRKPFVPG